MKRAMCLAALAAVLSGTTAGAATVVKMATLVPQGSAWHTALQEMAAEWKKASGGAVELRLYPGGVAGDDQDVVRKMRLGTLDAGLLTSAGLGDIDRAVFALALPMEFASYAELDAVLEQVAPALEQAFADKGFIVLNWVDAGWVHFFAKRPIRTPDELRAEKLFVWSGDSPTVELWKAAGFNPVPLPSTEISTALQTGLVTALPTTPQAAVLLQWYTHAPHMTDLKWGVLLGGTVVRKASWERIPAEHRPALLEAGRTAGRKLRELTRGGAERDIEAMASRGLEVIHLDDAAIEAWHKAAVAAYPTLRGSYAPGEWIDRALAARDAFRNKGGR